LSVFSSFIKKKKSDFPLNSKETINKWKKSLNKKYFLKTKIINLNLIKSWNLSKKKIFHQSKHHFSVIGVNVKTNMREVIDWDQPIIQGSKMAFAGYLIKKFKNTDHYLCRYILKPGSKVSTYTCSVNTSKLNGYTKKVCVSSYVQMVIQENTKKK